jgi:hypothetical protein
MSLRIPPGYFRPVPVERDTFSPFPRFGGYRSVAFQGPPRNPLPQNGAAHMRGAFGRVGKA